MSTKLTCLIFLCFCISNAAFSQTYSRGMDLDDDAYTQAPKKAQLTRALGDLPQKASIKQYAPIPKTQGNFGTCAAWASAYCGRTLVDAIKNNWTDKEMITKNAYSPAFLFRLLKPDDGSCTGGSVIEYALQQMKTKGSIPFNVLPALCIPTVDVNQMNIASSRKLKDYARLFDVGASDNFKIQATKKSLSEKKPVVIGMICPPSFDHAVNYWQPTEQSLSTYGGHAMCVVGYDDNLYGGAFEIQNSWGESWGNKGYIWIRYNDFSNFVKYAYEFVDLPDPNPTQPDLSGSIKLLLSTGAQMPLNLQVSTRGLKVVPANNTVEPLTIYKTSTPYTSGTNFRIYITNDEPAYVYALSSDLTNVVTKIFPYNDKISAALTYKQNAVAIPDEDHFVQFDNVVGTDYLCVLYSRNELNINDLIKKVSAQTGTFNQRIFQVIGDKILNPKNIQFSSDNISFKGFSNGKEVVALMVELDHK